MKLFTPGWKSADPDKVERWIGKQKPNAPHLVDLMNRKLPRSVLAKALDKISDQRMLETFVRKGGTMLGLATGSYTMRLAAEYGPIQFKAIEKITDQDILLSLIREGYFPRDASGRYWPYKNLNEDNLLAVLTDPAYLSGPAKKSESYAESCALGAYGVLEETENRDAIVRAAKETIYSVVSNWAVGKVVKKGWASFGEIADDAGYCWYSRYCAVCGASDRGRAVRMAENGDVPAEIRIRIVRETDLSQEELKKLLENETDEEVRTEILKKIKDPEIRGSVCQGKAAGSPLHQWKVTETVNGYRWNKAHQRFVTKRESIQCVWCGLTSSRYYEYEVSGDNAQ